LIVNVTPLGSTPIRAAPIGSGRLGLTEGFEAEGDVQGGMLDRERSVPKERRILFRIGLNLGDVINERPAGL
jgi:hypothetical protein